MTDSEAGFATQAPSRMRVWVHRTAAVCGAGAAVVLALWAAGVRIPVEWFKNPPPAAVAQQAPVTAKTPIGAAPPTPPAQKPPGVDAFESPQPIPLVLASTSPGRNVREGSAAIGTSLETAVATATGGLLSNGARLIEVHNDHVLLERDRARVELFVGNSRSPRVLGNLKASDRMTAEQQVLAVGGPQSRGVEVKPPPLSAATALLRSQPVYVNGQLKGLQVDPGSAADKFAASGLQPADLVVAIDGLKIEQPEQIEDLFGALGTSVPVVITIERAGQLEHISIDMSRLEAPMSSPAADTPAPPLPSPMQAT